MLIGRRGDCWVTRFALTQPTDAKERLLDAFAIADILWFAYWALANDRLMKACGKEKLMSFQPGRLAGELKNFITACHGLAH